jgi:capsular exopolysaccharide synthesis family protein
MNDFLKYFKILRRRWLPASLAFSLGLVWGGWRVSQEIPIYEATGQLLFKRDQTASVTQLAPAGLRDTTKLGNEATILQSQPLLEKAAAILKLKETPNNIRGSLNIIDIKGTDILNISYKNADPKKAEQLINTLMALYIDLDNQNAQRGVIATKDFIAKQLPRLEVSTRQVEAKLKTFKQKNRVLDIKAEAASTVEIISSLDSQAAATQTELATQLSRLQSLASLFGTDPQEAVVSGFVAESPTANSLLGKLQELQEKIRTERLRFGENHPQIVYLKQQQAILRQELQNYLQRIFVGQAGRKLKGMSIKEIVQPGPNQQQLLQEFNATAQQVRGLQVKLQSLQQQIDIYKKRVNQIPELEFQQRRIERELAARDSAYDTLLQRYQEVLIEASRKSSDVQVVQKAELPVAPIPSRKLLYLIQGALLGAILAWGVAWLLEQLDKTARTPEAVKKLLDYPTLGTIPEFPKALQEELNRPVMIQYDPHSPISEAFRILYTNLRFVQSERPLRAIALSSAIMKEGKSTTAANLAATCAELGRRVLLIDCDLRNPSQHKVWQLPNEGGMLSLLQKKAEIADVARQVMPNLDVIVAGGVNRNPIALLDSSQMAAAIAYGSQNYDLVIIDTPPLTVAADATILGKLVDGLLFVVRPSRVNVFSLESSRDLLEQSNQKVLGMVFNGISPGDTYGYSYKYPYVYGSYGQETQLKSTKDYLDKLKN